MNLPFRVRVGICDEKVTKRFSVTFSGNRTTSKKRGTGRRSEDKGGVEVPEKMLYSAPVDEKEILSGSILCGAV
jgi:hypothetical protein